MPRRKGSEADSAVSKARKTRWRYLLRNPDFRGEINELLDTYDLIGEERRRQRGAPTRDPDTAMTTASSDVGGLRQQLRLPPLSDAARRRAELQAKASRLEEKLTAVTTPYGLVLPVWELRRGRVLDWSVQGQTLPKLTVDTVVQYKKLIGDDSPVTIIEDYDGETCLRADELGNPHTMYLAVDLAYPRDVPQVLMEEALRRVVEERSAIIKRDPRKRQRSDKADFDIAVYDLVTNGETFQTIAVKLRRPISSVKSAHLAACKNIFGSGAPRSKRDMPLLAFDVEGHVPNCEICSAAKAPEEMCTAARAFVDQDYRSRDELPVGLEVSVPPSRKSRQRQ